MVTLSIHTVSFVSGYICTAICVSSLSNQIIPILYWCKYSSPDPQLATVLLHGLSLVLQNLPNVNVTQILIRLVILQTNTSITQSTH